MKFERRHYMTLLKSRARYLKDASLGVILDNYGPKHLMQVKKIECAFNFLVWCFLDLRNEAQLMQIVLE